MDSPIWTKTSRLPPFNPLTTDLKTDVLIVGGGIAGLLCAHLLTQAGAGCVLAEADQICGGTTRNTTAKLTIQHGLIYHRLIRESGIDAARLYLGANRAALEQYRTLCRTIPCGFEERDSFVYALDGRRELERELAALEQLGCPASLETDLPLPISTAGAVKIRRQAQFHPLLFAAGIAKGLRIFEHTKVLELAPGRAVTNGGTISADHIVIATHFPLLNKHGGYFLKLYQHRSYVLALKNAQNVGGMYVDADKRGWSFRNYGDLLLLGGGGHRTGKQSGGWRELEAFARQHWPNAKVAARWAAQDCMSLDGAPYIGPYSKGTPGLYVATGFNKWGMTSAMVAAMVLTDLIQGRDSPYAPAFCPTRTILRPQLAVNALEAAANLLTPTVPRCPHMGCALKYNAAEHSWDCPCHGSRFGEDGTLIDGPATDDHERLV